MTTVGAIMTAMPPSDLQNAVRASAINKLWTAILFSLPTIVGTALFLAAAIAPHTPVSNYAAFDPRPLTNFERLARTFGPAIYFSCYVGATLGPVLLPVATQQAYSLSRATGLRSRFAIGAWTFVVLGLVSAALFWGWLIKLDIFV